MEIQIKRIAIEAIDICVDLLSQIEILSGSFDQDQLLKRLDEDPVYVLVAYDGQLPVGFKIAYDRYDDGTLYSWLGGVIQPYRRRGVASRLLRALEIEARKDGFTSIRFKTQNHYREMLAFAIHQRFNIVDFEEDNEIAKSVIVFERTIPSDSFL